MARSRLRPPDRQTRRLNKLNAAGFAILDLDLAIQAERNEALDFLRLSNRRRVRTCPSSVGQRRRASHRPKS